jgi:hypothetical protein
MRPDEQRRHEEAKAKLPIDLEVACSRDWHTLTVTPDLELLVPEHDVTTYAAFRAFGAGKPPRCIEVWEAWQRHPGQGLRKITPAPEDVLTIAWAGNEDVRGYIGLNWKGFPLETRYELLMASTPKWRVKAAHETAVFHEIFRYEVEADK